MRVKSEHIILFLLFLFLFAVRLNNISADPPISFSFVHVAFDEGWKAINARNKVIFGEWGENLYFLINHPVFVLIQFFVFKLFGVGIVQARMVSITGAFFSFLLLYKIAKKDIGKRWGFMLLFLLGTNFIFLIFNRVAVLETTVMFFMILTMFLWHKGEEKPFYYFLAGFSTILSCCVKMYCVFMIPVCVAAFLWSKKEQNSQVSIRTFFLYFIGGILSGIFSWFLCWLFFFNFSSEYHRVFQTLFPNIYVSTIEKNLASQTYLHHRSLLPFLLWRLKIVIFYMERFSLPLFMVWIYLVYLFNSNKLRKKAKIPLTRSECFSIVWIVFGFLFFFLTCVTFRLRSWYVVILLPPIYFLTNVGLKKLMEENKLRNIQVPKKHFYFQFITLKILVFQIVLSAFLIWFLKDAFPTYIDIKYIIRSNIWQISILLSILAFLLEAYLLNVLPINPDKFKFFARIMGIAFILLHLSVNGYLYWRWNKWTKHTIVNVSKDLDDRLDKDAVLLGGIHFCLESKMKIVTSYYSAEQATHIFTRRADSLPRTRSEIPNSWRHNTKNPNVVPKMKLIKVYVVMGNTFYLYEKIPPYIT